MNWPGKKPGPTKRPAANKLSHGRTFEVPYILEYNPHPFYSFRGLKNQIRIRFVVESWILEK
jgi:hypothetical protein